MLEGRKKSVWRVFWTTSEFSVSTPASGRVQPRTRGEWRKTAEQGAERFTVKMDRCRKSQCWTTACRSMPERDGKERIAQSKRAHAGSLAIDEKPQVARTCILRVFGLQISCRLSLMLLFVLFLFRFRSFCFCQSRGLSFNRSSWEVSPFPSNLYHWRFLVCMESTLYLFLTDGVF